MSYDDTERLFSIQEILTSVNLAEDMDEDSLMRVGMEVTDGFDTDLATRSDWEERQEASMKLAMQVVESKTFPWDGAANVKYPLLTTAALQFSARAYPALVNGVNVVKGKVTGFDLDGSKAEKADRIGKHMSYQLIEEMEDWEEDMDRLCVSLPILGTVFKKTYFSDVKGTNVSEIVYPKDLVVDYWAKSLEDAYRVTHRLYMDDNDVYERVAAGVFKQYDDLEEGVQTTSEASDELVGLSRPSSNEDCDPYEILEQHTYLDLDGDGYKEPYVVTVHRKTGRVLRIVARFDESGLFLDGDKVLRIVPTQYFTKFSFVPNPDGAFYDIGFGQLLGPINETINTIINQLLDAGTLSNMQSGFISKGIRMTGGNKNFKPGEWKWVNTTGDDLRKSLVPLPVREPSNVLFTLLGSMVESGEKMAAVTDMLLGQNPGQNQPATTSMTVLEQGLKVFTSIYKRLHRALKKEYKKLFYLNSKYLPEESYFTVLDVGKEGAAQIKKMDYDVASFDVQPYADPNTASESLKMLKAQALMELLPVGTINPLEVTKRILLAQDQPNIEALLVDPSQNGPSPEQMKMEIEKGRLDIEAARVRIEEMSAKAKSILDIAKAEAAEIGSQIEQYRAVMEAIALPPPQDNPMQQQGMPQSPQQGQPKMPPQGGM